jgi:hypothetical protein
VYQLVDEGVVDITLEKEGRRKKRKRLARSRKWGVG